MAHPARWHVGADDPALEAKAEAFVQQQLAASHEPLVAVDVVVQAAQAAAIPFTVVRSAIWSLVGQGIIQLTSDWRIRRA